MDAIFANQTTSGAITFARIFKEFVQIFRYFARVSWILLRFSGILPRFSPNENLCWCTCTPCPRLPHHCLCRCLIPESDAKYHKKVEHELGYKPTTASGVCVQVQFI